jgi:2-dehydropantoate 2-reductase
MKIAVMGSGGIGGYFGGFLAERNEVTFIARGAHLAAMRENGLSLSGPRGDKVIDASSATDDPSDIGQVELVLFCVKLYDTESAGELIAPLMGEHSRVLSLQNGVDGPERLAKIFGAGRVLGGSAYVSAHIAAPGQIKYMSEMSRIVFGTLDNKPDSAAEAILAACEGADFNAELSDNVSRVLWSKMVLLAANAGVSSMTRQPVRAVYDDPQSRQVAIDAMGEVAAVAHARGVDLPDDLIAGLIATSEKFPPDMHASMCHDLLAERRIEIDGLSGLIARLGDELNVPVPVNRTIAVALGPYRDGTAS